MRMSDRPSRRSWRTALAGFTVGMTLVGLSAVPAIAANGTDHGCGGTVSAVAQQKDTDTGRPATGGFDNHGGFVSDTARDCAAQQGLQGGTMQNSDEDQQTQQGVTQTTDDDQMVQSSGGTMQNTDEDQDTNKVTDRDNNTGEDSNQDRDTNQGGAHGSQGENHGQPDREDSGKSKH